MATELDVALQRFYTVQVRWSANGAFDTEPRSVMNGLLEQASPAVDKLTNTRVH